MSFAREFFLVLFDREEEFFLIVTTSRRGAYKSDIVLGPLSCSAKSGLFRRKEAILKEGLLHVFTNRRPAPGEEEEEEEE